MQYHHCLLPRPSSASPKIEKWSSNRPISLQTQFTPYISWRLQPFLHGWSPNDLPLAEVKLSGANVLVPNPVVYAVLSPRSLLCQVSACSLPAPDPILSIMQSLRIELLARPYDLSAYDRPRLIPHFSPILPCWRFVFVRQDAQPEASMMQSSCKLTSHVGRNRSFSSQVSPDQGIQRISLSPPDQVNSPRSFSDT